MKQENKNSIKNILLLTILLSSQLYAQSFVLMDFEDSVLHDESWLLSQPLDTVDFFVGPRSSPSGINILTLGVGEGRDGGNALRVESHDAVVSSNFIRTVVVSEFSVIFEDGFEVINPDLQAPIRSSGNPSGMLLAETTSVTLSLTTDQIATCRYATMPNISYQSMADTFAATTSISHSSTITGLVNGNNYSYYVRCIDAAGNQNTDDFLISFSVANATTTPVQLGDYWLFYGDSETSGRADEIYTKSQALAFESIWSSAVGAVPQTHINGQGGVSLYATSLRYGSRSDRNLATFVHFQESGTQARTGQYTAAEFAETFEDFVRQIKLESPNAVISTETAFSFLSDERWVPYNDAMMLKIALLALEGITVYVAEVDRNIKELIAQTSFYAVSLADDIHYTGLGNFMIAVSMYDALGFDVNTLDLSGVPDGEVSIINKQLVIDIVSSATTNTARAGIN